MREIKFRAWDKKIKEMFYYIPLYVDEGPGFDILDFTSYLDYEFMQYTGLNDKNGKGIYEGDICKQKGMNDIVKFVNGAFWWGMLQGDLLVDADLEVIGNIYENPELLETKI